MKIKVSETTPLQLDWLVAKCWYSDEYDKDRVFLHHSGFDWAKHTVRIANQSTCTRDLSFEWEPTTNWSQGGPIIEREGLHLRKSGCEWQCDYWNESTLNFDTSYGLTPLIAAMRCYVASKLGDEVEVPDELETT